MAIESLAAYKRLKEAEVITETGARLPEHTSFDHWSTFLHLALFLERSANWIIGDLANYGQNHFGEAHAQQFPLDQHSAETIRSAQWVASRIPYSRRRPAPITWSHHRAVASLEPAEQERFLDMVADQRLNVYHLLNKVKKFKKEQKSIEEQPQWTSDVFSTEVPPEQVAVGLSKTDVLKDFSNRSIGAVWTAQKHEKLMQKIQDVLKI